MKNYEVYGKRKDKWALPRKIVELDAPSEGEAVRLGSNFAKLLNVEFISVKRKKKK